MEEQVSKDAFKTSGSSPHLSENGAPVLTGRGVEDVKRRIMAAFEQVHRGHPAPEKQPRTPQVYSEVHKERFHQRAKSLTRSALTLGLPHISKARNGVYEIVAPQETAEDLFRAALGDE
jgi:hypothetical protein